MGLSFDPDEPAFQGLNRPVRAEASVEALEVQGTIPEGLRGSYYRVGPDPTYPPFHRHFAPVVDGNGMMVMFRFRDGQVDFRSRYVETERLLLERAANRALFGEYRNPFTDDPSVRDKGISRGTANTTMREHAGILWALKEDALGVRIEEGTLKTLGTYDFNGCVTSRTMTAHPKIDGKTGEMIFYGAMAKGEATPDIALYTADADGKITREQWFQAPYASMIHDFAATENWIVIPVMPNVADLDRMRAGGSIYNWEPQLGMHLGLVPRKNPDAPIRWIHTDARWFYHAMNAFEDESGKIHMDVAASEIQPFPFFHVNPEATYDMMKAAPFLTRWTIDPAAGSFSTQQLMPMPMEMPRIDERHELDTYRHGWALAMDPSKPSPGGEGTGSMNSIAHVDHATGALTMAYAGAGNMFEEPAFVPRSAEAPEGDGWLLAIRHSFDTRLSELVVFDTADLAGAPQCVVKLPFRVRPGTHGNWVPQR